MIAWFTRRHGRRQLFVVHAVDALAVKRFRQVGDQWSVVSDGSGQRRLGPSAETRAGGRSHRRPRDLARPAGHRSSVTKTDFTPRPSDDIAPRLTDYGLPIK